MLITKMGQTSKAAPMTRARLTEMVKVAVAKAVTQSYLGEGTRSAEQLARDHARNPVTGGKPLPNLNPPLTPVQIAARVNGTIPKPAMPSAEQIRANGGGVLGVLRAQRQRAGEQ